MADVDIITKLFSNPTQMANLWTSGGLEMALEGGEGPPGQSGFESFVSENFPPEQAGSVLEQSLRNGFSMPDSVIRAAQAAEENIGSLRAARDSIDQENKVRETMTNPALANVAADVAWFVNPKFAAGVKGPELEEAKGAFLAAYGVDKDKFEKALEGSVPADDEKEPSAKDVVGGVIEGAKARAAEELSKWPDSTILIYDKWKSGISQGRSNDDMAVQAILNSRKDLTPREATDMVNNWGQTLTPEEAKTILASEQSYTSPGDPADTEPHPMAESPLDSVRAFIMQASGDEDYLDQYPNWGERLLGAGEAVGGYPPKVQYAVMATEALGPQTREPEKQQWLTDDYDYTMGNFILGWLMDESWNPIKNKNSLLPHEFYRKHFNTSPEELYGADFEKRKNAAWARIVEASENIGGLSTENLDLTRAQMIAVDESLVKQAAKAMMPRGNQSIRSRLAGVGGDQIVSEHRQEMALRPPAEIAGLAYSFSRNEGSPWAVTKKEKKPEPTSMIYSPTPSQRAIA